MSLSSKLTSAYRGWTELWRSIGFPLRMLLYLPKWHEWQRRTAELLAAPPRPDQIVELNEEARGRFRPCVEGSEMRRVFVSCAEHSGEGHARAFVEELRQQLPDVEVVGFGGRVLEASGVRLLGNLVDVAVMGARQVFANIFFYLGIVSRYVELLERERPDVVVLLDSPALHVIFGEEAKKRGIPVLYYICPQYWAWAPWRMRRFRRAVDGAISILPFERPLFEAAGVPTAFAGSPLMTRVPELAPEPREPLLAMLPGSRRTEIERHLPPMLELWNQFKERYPEARAVIPQHSKRHVDMARRILAETHDVRDLEIVESGVFPVLSRARAALVKSGTSTLQTALCRTPQVIAYDVGSRLYSALLKRYLTSPWIGAPNLVLGRTAIPEFVFRGSHVWPRVFERLLEIWEDGEPRRAQLAACDEIRRRLDGPGATTEAVRWVLSGLASSAAGGSSAQRAEAP